MVRRERREGREEQRLSNREEREDGADRRAKFIEAGDDKIAQLINKRRKVLGSRRNLGGDVEGSRGADTRWEEGKRR